MRRLKSFALIVPLVVSGTVGISSVRAQSEAPSRASVASAAPSAALVEIAAVSVVSGAELAVDAVRIVGKTAYVTVRAVATGAVATVELAAHVVVGAGIAVGTAIAVVATAGGYLLQAAGETLVFVPDAATRALMHERKAS